MQRTATAALAALLVIGTLAAVPVAMAQGADQTSQTNRTAGNSSVAPGEQLSAVVGVGEAELSGDVESRAYSIRVDRANSSDAKAAVVADQLNATDERLAELEAEKAELQAARDNDSISEGQYRARMATLHAESQSASRLANQTNETAGELPAETLEANGVNVTAIRTLQDRAANLSGPETAAIARSIAGENVGQTARAGEAADRSGAGDRAGASGGTDTETRDGSTNQTSDGSTTETSDGSTNQTSDGSTTETSDGSTNQTSDGSTTETSDGSTPTEGGSTADGSDSSSTDGTDSESPTTRRGPN
ncbi:hypothetical protein [Haloarcula sediminis]|uniref:hypothetical protein n=1 Tax=Haloarcula sediminis TaxID=3111777 RepID=UPI002D76A27C|nr:hypothetical protein [Haloarcula sp. CK38]